MDDVLVVIGENAGKAFAKVRDQTPWRAIVVELGNELREVGRGLERLSQISVCFTEHLGEHPKLADVAAGL